MEYYLYFSLMRVLWSSIIGKWRKAQRIIDRYFLKRQGMYLTQKRASTFYQMRHGNRVLVQKI